MVYIPIVDSCLSLSSFVYPISPALLFCLSFYPALFYFLSDVARLSFPISYIREEEYSAFARIIR